MKHFEEKIGSKRVYEGKIINLRRDTVRLENGKEALREVIEHPGGVSVLAIDEQDEIYMVRQFRYPTGKELWELPAGKLEFGEDPLACGIRELEEECGCKAEHFSPLAQLYPTCAYDTEIIYVYLAKGLTASKQCLDEGEFLTVEKMPFSKALEMVLAGEVPDAKTQVGILKYAALRACGKA